MSHLHYFFEIPVRFVRRTYMVQIRVDISLLPTWNALYRIGLRKFQRYIESDLQICFQFFTVTCVLCDTLYRIGEEPFLYFRKLDSRSKRTVFIKMRMGARRRHRFVLLIWKRIEFYTRYKNKIDIFVALSYLKSRITCIFFTESDECDIQNVSLSSSL